MEKQYMFVYLTTNLINGKKYIGKHMTNNIDDGYLGSGCLLKKAIEKYGRENFKREIICFAENEDDLNQKEIESIREYNAKDDPNYYNLLPGGKGGFAHPRCGKDHPMFGRKGELSPVYGRKQTQHAKEILRQKALERFKDKRNHPSYGRRMSEESRAKMRKAKEGMYLGENNPNYGKKHTEETRQQISQKRKGKLLGSENPNAKPPVQCVETGEIYECATFAGRALGCDRHWIAQCCQGKRKTAAGFHWKYVTEISNANPVPSRSNSEGVSTISQESSDR